MTFYLGLSISLLINALLLWYLVRLLRKFFFVSQNITDLYFTMKAFQVFVKSLYSMDSYHGEPFIQELIARMRDVNEAIELFRDVFEHTLDMELEEELNAAEEEEEQEEP